MKWRCWWMNWRNEWIELTASRTGVGVPIFGIIDAAEALPCSFRWAQHRANGSPRAIVEKFENGTRNSLSSSSPRGCVTVYVLTNKKSRDIFDRYDLQKKHVRCEMQTGHNIINALFMLFMNCNCINLEHTGSWVHITYYQHQLEPFLHM